MNEWKDLEIDNLPNNFGKENYQFEVYHEDDNRWHEVYNDYRTIATIISYLKDGSKYHYRKPEPEPEPKQPTHIKHEDILEMLKLIGDNPAFPTDIRYHAFEVFSYINRESADIPPEETS